MPAESGAVGLTMAAVDGTVTRAVVVTGASPVLRFNVPGAIGVMHDEPHEVLLVVGDSKVRQNSVQMVTSRKLIA